MLTFPPKAYSPQQNEKKKKTTTSDIIDNISKALLNPLVADVQEHACKLITRNRNANNLRVIVEASGISMIANAMKNHRENTDILIEAFHALASLAWQSKSDPDAIENVANSGVFEEIAVAAKKSWGRPGMKKKVIEEALGALEHLAGTTSVFKKRMVTSLCLDTLVLESMKNHYAKNVLIQTKCCTIIQDMAHNDDP